jgi:hypothetical protein
MLPIAAIVAAIALLPAALAQQAAPTSKADCVKAKMKWDEKGGKDGKGACVTAGGASKK